jgi:2-keto-4-pentenoate hydratase
VIDVDSLIHPKVEAEIAFVLKHPLKGPCVHVGDVLAATATATAAGAAVLGHPAQSVAMLANMLAAQDKELPAGTFIMTGGVTEAIAVEAGDQITVRYQHLGSVSMRFASTSA